MKHSALNLYEYQKLYEQALPEDSALYELAKKYHDLTEAYDQSVCHVRNERGVAIPVTPQQRSLCNANAISALKTLSAGFSREQREELLCAIQEYRRR